MLPDTMFKCAASVWWGKTHLIFRLLRTHDPDRGVEIQCLERREDTPRDEGSAHDGSVEKKKSTPHGKTRKFLNTKLCHLNIPRVCEKGRIKAARRKSR